MKVLLLNQCFWPDIAATGQHLSDLALGLSERGHEVTVVCADRGYDNPQARFARRQRWQDIEIIRVRSIAADKKRRWQRGLNFASFLFACAARLLFMPRQDVVIALTSPPLISWLASWFTRLRGGRLIFWVMDLNPDEAIAAGWLARKSFTAKLLERLLITSMKRSAKIVVLDRFVKQRILAKGISSENIQVIPPWSLDGVAGYDEEGREGFRRQHGLTDKFVVMHAGNHSPCHPLVTLLQTADKLKYRRDIVFCFVGGGSEFAAVQQFAASRELEGIVCLPYQSRDELAPLLSAADLHVVIMGDPFVGIIHPSKIYNVIKVGASFLYIGPSQSHVTDLIDNIVEQPRVYAARHGEVDRVVEQILSVAENYTNERRATLGESKSTSSLVEMLETVEDQLPPARLPLVEGYVVEDKSTVTEFR